MIAAAITFSLFSLLAPLRPKRRACASYSIKPEGDPDE
jgi:hypothetical protein